MPAVSNRSRVFAVLDQAERSIRRIHEPALRQIIPVLEKAQREVRHNLTMWLRTAGADATFTAQRYRNALIVLNRALKTAEHLGPVTEHALKKSYGTVAPLAVQNLQHQWSVFQHIFEGTVQPLAIDEVVVIATGKSLLWPQFESSAERYAGSIGERTKLELAVSRAQSETIDELTNRLQRNVFSGEQGSAFFSERWDAERLARTETMASYSETTEASLREALAEDPELRKRWCSAVGDFRRCPMCASLEGQVVEVDEPFHAEWDTVSKRGSRHHSLEVEKAPAHPCCLPGTVEVTSSSRITAASKRWYDGEIVIIRTATGKQLSSSPNHPILTDGGWIAAGLLDVGSRVVCDIGRQWTASVDIDHEDMPAGIEKVAESFGHTGQMTSAEVPTTAEDFHGDGEGSKVAIIWADRLLLNALDSAIRQHGTELSLQRADTEQGLLSSASHLDPLFRGVLDSRHGHVGGMTTGIALLLSHLAHREGHGLAEIANVDPASDEQLADAPPGDTKSARDGKLGGAPLIGCDGSILVDGLVSEAQGNSRPEQPILNGAGADPKVSLDGCDSFPEEIALDDVVSVQREQFHGFVYNLQTVSGHYTAAGIIVHNCACVETVWRESWAKYSRRDQGSERAAA